MSLQNKLPNTKIIENLFFQLGIVRDDSTFRGGFFQEKDEPEFNVLIEKLEDYFKIPSEDIGYILCILEGIETKLSSKEILNIVEIASNVISHLEYYYDLWDYKKINYRNFDNTHFHKYLLKKKKIDYFLTDYKIAPRFPVPGQHIDQRRPLDIDENQFFNYICLMCKYREGCRYRKTCTFSHNDYELLYHPICFRKIKCHMEDRCEDKDMCAYFHDSSDMECDINFISEEIKDILNLMNKRYQEGMNFESEYPLSEFNPFTYKTYKCPLGIMCRLGEKGCFNYHSDKDRRRYPVNYKPSKCAHYLTNSSETNEIQCKDKDACEFSHNMYESLYHEHFFRKGRCVDGEKCENRLTCPFLHAGEKEIKFGDNKKIICDEDLVFNYYLKKIESCDPSKRGENSEYDF